MTDANDPIPQITRDDEAAGSGDMVAGNVARLKALFPEIVTDGKVDFDVLRELLGDAVEEGEERYGLNWKGKRKARAFALTPSLGTLLPAPEDSVEWDTTQNLIIEGENLEVLKILRRSYAGNVKFIFIDPPYNTGNDFVYPDNYRNSINNYMCITGQRGSGGEVLTSDREGAGRLHTDWLNMIYPRLVMAKEIMDDDAVLAVSIDDVEIDNLLACLKQVFGDEGHVATIVWQKRYVSNVTAINLSDMHDFVVIFAKNPQLLSVNDWDRTAEQLEAYRNPDNDPRGLWRAQDLSASKFYSAGQFEITGPKGQKALPPPNRYWRCNEAQFNEWVEDGRIWWGVDQSARPMLKSFLSESERGIKPHTWWDYSSAGHNKEATLEVKGLFDGAAPFDTPKPVKLIRRLISTLSGSTGIFVDFFAGSGTTGHAVLAQNAEDGGSRRYILVQLPEPLEAGDSTAIRLCDALQKPHNIAELTKERLRRAGAKIRKEHPDAKVDTGFRVYKLATSNLKPWQPDGDNLEASILDAVDNVLPGRTEEDLLVELLLKTGIDLTLPEEKRTIAGQTVHALGGGTLMVCLGNIGADDAEALGQGMADWVDALDPVQTTVYFKDTGLGADGNRAATKANLAAILRQRLGDRIAKIASI